MNLPLPSGVPSLPDAIPSLPGAIPSLPGAILPGEPFAVVRPAYGGGSLADVLPGVCAALGVPGSADPLGLTEVLAGVDRVAVLLVDGLGAYQLPSVLTHAPALGQLARRTITAGFPSTTPVSLATLATGVPPGAHGILGFTTRLASGETLNHIRWGDEPDPAVWQPAPTRFETARAAGVRSTLVTRRDFRGTGLTEACYRGADFAGADSGAELASAMLAALASPGIVYGYHPDLDQRGHSDGVGSAAWIAAASGVGSLVSRLLSGLPAGAALLVTADHGQLNVPLSDRFDIGDISDCSASVVGVAGEPRVRYLHVVPGAVGDVVAACRERLGASAMVLTRDEAIDSGLFGPVAAAHRDRIGDVVIICLGETVVLARDWEPAAVGQLVAYHGSLTAIEMTVPLLSFVGPPA